MRTIWTFHSATSLVFGRHAVNELGERIHRIGARRAFIVTDPLLVRIGLLEPVQASLRSAHIETHVFDQSEPEPSLNTVRRCVDAARPVSPDVVVALGGGSNMDVAKMAAAMLAHPGDIRDFLGDDRIPGPTVPVVCIPTTAGTGSEVSGAAAFTDTDAHVKCGALSNYFRPQIAIVDPLLTVSCPKKVTADSGIDALTHAIEAFTAVDNAHFPLPPGERSVYQGRHPFGDMLAEKAIQLCGQHLRRAVDHPQDLEAREGMALAATLAGLAFSNVGVALVHAMEYPVGGLTNCSHGEGNGLLLPYVMEFNRPGREAEYAKIAEWLGGSDAVEAVRQLQKDIGIPMRLRELGIQTEQIDAMAEKALAIRRIIRVNPRPVTVEDCKAIYRAAL